MIKPLHDRILVEPLQSDTFILSDDPTIKEVGKVVALGPKIISDIKVGDTIFFTSWGLDKTAKHNEKEYYLVPDTSAFILGVDVAE